MISNFIRPFEVSNFHGLDESSLRICLLRFFINLTWRLIKTFDVCEDHIAGFRFISPGIRSNMFLNLL